MSWLGSHQGSRYCNAQRLPKRPNLPRTTLSHLHEGLRVRACLAKYAICQHLLHLQHGVQSADPARPDHIYTNTHATLVLTIHALIRLPQQYIGTAKRHIALNQFRISFDI
jgi:hypothetical protein